MLSMRPKQQLKLLPNKALSDLRRRVFTEQPQIQAMMLLRNVMASGGALDFVIKKTFREIESFFLLFFTGDVLWYSHYRELLILFITSKFNCYGT